MIISESLFTLRVGFGLIYFGQKKEHSLTVGPDNHFCKRSLFVKCWWNWSRPGLNFINVLCTAFALIDPESIKITVKSSVSFYAFGIYKRKAVCGTLMQLTPRCTNVEIFMKSNKFNIFLNIQKWPNVQNIFSG